MPRGWKVTLQIKPFGVTTGWSNVMHATIGKNIERYGDRAPGIWFLSKTTKLHICSAVNGNRNFCFNQRVGLPMNKYSIVTIQQIQKSQFGNLYYYQIIINGKLVVNVQNNHPDVFYNIKYFSSDPWYHAGKASVRNFKVTTFKHKGI